MNNWERLFIVLGVLFLLWLAPRFAADVRYPTGATGPIEVEYRFVPTGGGESALDSCAECYGVFMNVSGGSFTGNVTAPYIIANGVSITGIRAKNVEDIWVNESGDTMTGSLDVGGNLTGEHIYCGMYYHNHTATAVNFDVDGTYYGLWFTSAPRCNGFSYTGGFNASSNLTAQVAGTYQAFYMASGSGQNNHDYYTVIYVNETIQEHCESHKKMTAGGDIVTITGHCFIELDVGDDVSVRTADVGGTGAGSYYSGNFNLVRVGD